MQENVQKDFGENISQSVSNNVFFFRKDKSLKGQLLIKLVNVKLLTGKIAF